MSTPNSPTTGDQTSAITRKRLIHSPKYLKKLAKNTWAKQNLGEHCLGQVKLIHRPGGVDELHSAGCCGDCLTDDEQEAEERETSVESTGAEVEAEEPTDYSSNPSNPNKCSPENCTCGNNCT